MENAQEMWPGTPPKFGGIQHFLRILWEDGKLNRYM